MGSYVPKTLKIGSPDVKETLAASTRHTILSQVVSLRWSQRVITDIFSESKLRYACQNNTDDGIHSEHGYLDTCDNPLGPP